METDSSKYINSSLMLKTEIRKIYNLGIESKIQIELIQ